MNDSAASALVRFGIPGLALAVSGLFVLGAWASAAPREPCGHAGQAGRARTAGLSAASVLGLLAMTAAVAASGALADAAARPPRFVLVMVPVMAATVFLSRSELGRRLATRLPLWVLVGAQGFRLPLELVMRQAARDGVMPMQMSFEGYNFDVVTGVTALLVAAWLRFGAKGGAPSTGPSRAVVLAWNVLGSALLAVIVGIAITSLPVIAAFGPDHLNEFVLHFPYVWLATVLVPAALLGHLLVFRRLFASEAVSGLNPGKIPGSPPRDSALPSGRAR